MSFGTAVFFFILGGFFGFCVGCKFMYEADKEEVERRARDLASVMSHACKNCSKGK